MAVKSPCEDVCKVAPDGYCIACHRSIYEIGYWPHLTDEGKLEVLRMCDDRKKKRSAELTLEVKE